MARFFRTAQGRFVDNNTYQPPFQLMAQVIQNADSQVAQNETALLSLYDKLNANVLAVDEPRVKEIINNYTSQIDDLSSKIQKNPLEFRRDIGTIRNLGRQIAQDWQHGEVAAMEGNRRLRESWVKDHLEKVKAKEGRVTQDDVNYANQVFDRQFNSKGGTQYDNGRYNTYTTETLNPYVNLEDISEERAKGYISDVVSKNGAYSDGKYMYTSESKKEFVPYKTIKEGVMSAMLNDRELMSYYGQLTRLGRYDQQEVARRMEAAADRVAQKYSFTKEESGRKSVSGDPFALENLRTANDIKLEGVKFGHDMAKQQAQWEHESKKELPAVVRNVNARTVGQAQAVTQSYKDNLTEIGKRLGMSSGVSEQAIKDKLNYLKSRKGLSDKTYNSIMNDLKYSAEVYKKGHWEASYTSLADIFGTQAAVGAQKAMNSYTKDARNLYNVPMRFDLGNGYSIKGTVNELKNKSLANGNKMFKFVDANDNPINIVGTDSALPVIYDSDNFGKNDMQFQVELGDGRIVSAYASFNDLGLDKR